jgi:hypothetical protein
MKSLAAILVLLALAGCGTNSRTSEFRPGSATVRAVIGEVQYWNGEVWDRLRVNLDLTNGSRIRTGPASRTYLSVGRRATVKLFEGTEAELTAMMVRHHVGRDATRTVLELRQGSILGSIKESSPDSEFQVRSGAVTLDLRAGDFQFSAERRVQSIIGEMTVQASGKTYQLSTGEYFDLKKNEVGKLPSPIIIEVPYYPWTNMSSGSWPGSSSLSPFDRGLQNARHGWVDAPAGN